MEQLRKNIAAEVEKSKSIIHNTTDSWHHTVSTCARTSLKTTRQLLIQVDHISSIISALLEKLRKHVFE